MTYTQQGDRVTLEMTREEYDSLLLMAGFAAGAALGRDDMRTLWFCICLANKLNNGNPNFTAYAIPEEFRQ